MGQFLSWAASCFVSAMPWIRCVRLLPLRRWLASAQWAAVALWLPPAFFSYIGIAMDGVDIILSVGLFLASSAAAALGWQTRRQIGRVDDLDRRLSEASARAAATDARQDAQIEAAALAAAKAEELVHATEGRITKRLDEIAAKLDRLLERPVAP